MKQPRRVNRPADLSRASKVALVTGAAGTFGPHICAALQADGWKVAAAGRTIASLEARFWSGKPYPADARLGADIADPEQCQKLVREAESKLGPISLLVNNATGNSAAVQPLGLADASPTYCRCIFDVDVLAAIHLARTALPSLIRERGQILNISSVMIRSFGPGSFVYSAAKAALETLTEALAYELLPQGVRVNCVRLGWVPGEKFLHPALSKLDSKTATRLREDVVAEHIREIRKSLPCATGEEAAAVVAFLASPAARFINGAILPADGGYGAALLRASERALQEQNRRDGPGVSERWSKDSAGELAAWRKKRAS